MTDGFAPGGSPTPPVDPAYPAGPSFPTPPVYSAPPVYPAAPPAYPAAPPAYPATPPPYPPAPGAPAPGAPSVARPGRAAVWVPTLIAVLALAGSGFLGWKWHESATTLQEVRTTQHAVIAEAEAQRTDSEDARKAAVEYAKLLTSIDTAHLDEQMQKVIDGATGKFKETYASGSAALKEILKSNNASAKGNVLDSAVESVNGQDVVVLLFVDQAVTNATVPDPRLDRNRMKMTMTKVDGRWLTSNVELP
ncbi:MAG: Mce protein [Mycobacterium sp.]|nr:Mce protein [Mycobacterium sp.]